MIPEETKEMLAGLAFNAGMTPSEYLRNIILVHIHGQAEVVRSHARRLDSTAGIGRD